jgi:hypothetical protein
MNSQRATPFVGQCHNNSAFLALKIERDELRLKMKRADA